ncbi:hypothetical protein [Desulfovibrio oxyclinae]|jgi:hypothetical protein|uniref:hypothetical protein n=1 Tax=Desulfovibrio oxyclinae TaxID=63560 RepID=UPI000362718F|nr:hypothetical protein [Desulfovibrio oxyclinae]
MSEAKVFPMNTFVSVLRGQSADQEQLDMMAFILGLDEIDADFGSVAQSLAKAAIYEAEPGLTKYAEGDISKLGNQVKIAPIADNSQVVAVFDMLNGMKAENAKLKAENSDLASAKESAETDVKTLKAKVKTFEDFSAAGEKKIVASNTKIDEHIKKLNELMAEVEKVKKEGVVVAGAAGAEGAAAAPGDSPDTGGEPEADFGFGSNPFADSDW